MKYKDTDICVCKHDFQDHFLDLDGQVAYDIGGTCYLCYPFGDTCQKFKLNNLEYLESLYDKRTK